MISFTKNSGERLPV